MADFQALMGDSVDNIPGIPGVGPKTAAALLSAFASLEEIYAGLDRVGALPVRGAAKLAAKLVQHREAAYLARRLTVIACDMPLEVSHEALRRRKPDLEALGAFYDRQKFGPALRRQAERLAKRLVEPQSAAATSRRSTRSRSPVRTARVPSARTGRGFRRRAATVAAAPRRCRAARRTFPIAPSAGAVRRRA